DGDEELVRVRDNGVGIKAEALSRIFEMFVQGPRGPDRASGGLGLGLALVRNLVELHGGRVLAMSAGPGQGSTFEIRLPGLDPASVEKAGDDLPAAPPVADGIRVLVVDDNVDAAAMTAELLRTQGYEVDVAHDGFEALRIATARLPAVAVLDIGLPVMDGLELAERLRRQVVPPPRLVAVTGYGQERDRAQSRAAGFEAHLVKPVAMGDLLAAISDLDPT